MSLTPRQLTGTGLVALAIAMCALLTPLGATPAHAAADCAGAKQIYGAKENAPDAKSLMIINLPSPYTATTLPNMWTSWGGQSQRWCMEPVGTSYIIRNARSRMCLDLSAAASNGVRVIHLPCASTRSTQRWAKAKPRAKSFALVNQSSGAHYCLDVVDKNPLGGALLQTWGCSWAWNQYWFFG